MSGIVAISPTTTIAEEQRNAAPSDRALVDRLGGRRGLLDGALPPAVFVLVHAASPSVGGSEALRQAVAAALTTGAVLIAVRLLRREALMSALRGLAGLAVAVLFAAVSGEARDFFLPGIVVDAAYAVVFAGSAVLGRPLVGFVHAVLYGTRRTWREDRHLRSVFTIATLGWTFVFAIRTSVQVAFYLGDVPGLLAVSKLVLGWPLTVAAVVLTLAYLRRATGRP